MQSWWTPPYNISTFEYSFDLSWHAWTWTTCPNILTETLGYRISGIAYWCCQSPPSAFQEACESMWSSQFQVDLWERSRLHVFLQWRHGATGKSQEKRTKMPASRKKNKIKKINRFPIALFYRQCTHPKSFRALFDSWEHHHLGTKSWLFDTSKFNALRFAYENIGSWDDDSNELIYVSSSWPEFQLHNSTKPNIQFCASGW